MPSRVPGHDGRADSKAAAGGMRGRATGGFVMDSASPGPVPSPPFARVTDNADLTREFQRIVGRSHVLTSPRATRRFRPGIRFGSGPVVAVVRPGSLVEQWRVLRACVAAARIVIMQASNTGVTGGSTPDGDDYDRGVVLIDTMRIEGLHLINDGTQVVCLPGTTPFHLEKACLSSELHRGEGQRRPVDRGAHLEAARPAWREVSRRAQCRASLSCKARTGVALQGARPVQRFNPGIGRTTKCAHWMPGKDAAKPDLSCDG